ncbi:alpha/beta hydrolase [Salinibacterium sp. M195]|nr:alpha/beta hydrolase fold domain-containing protein [Salinibacterium sp. M195]QYH37108.1 alpha/beta hydrolase [Salinibacterium sp. M195]
MIDSVARPPYDRETREGLAALPGGGFNPLTAETILSRRAAISTGSYEEQFAGQPTRRVDHTINGHRGEQIEVSVIARADHDTTGAGILFVHGGGMIAGDRFAGIDRLTEWIVRDDVVVIAVEYRLAPEHPDPTPVEDAYAALVWAAENAEMLGFDPRRLITLGISAGGGVAAGMALLARDRSGPPISAQMLLCPMLDDRDDTVSSQQFEGIGTWDRESNRTGWGALLGARAGTADVSIYAAAGREENLSSLPPTFIDCGSAEVFRDECVSFASRIWAVGGQAELHIWDGGFHGFDVIAPDAIISKSAIATRDSWMRRQLTG